MTASRVAAALAAIVVCLTAGAQTYNVDVNVPEFAPTRLVPGNGYGAAMGTPGTWNDYQPGTGTGTTLGLRNTANALTGVTFRVFCANGFQFAGHGSAVGTTDYDHLMNDFAQPVAGAGGYQAVFANLPSGYYEGIVYDYGGRLAGWTVNYEVLQTRQSIDLVSPSYGLMRNGREYARFGQRVFPDGTYGGMVAVMGRDAFSTPAAMFSPAGFQLRRLTRLYVAGDAAAGGSGGGWDSPLRTIREALELCAFDTGILEVWVKRGTYVEAGGRDGALTVPFGVFLRGGFAGTETAAAQRPQSSDSFYRTVIDGKFGPGANDEAFHVFNQTGSGASAFTLDRLTIRNGKANGAGEAGRGGGLLVRDALGTVTGCRFESCEGISGGGVYIGGGRVALSDCEFDQNGAGTVWGGAGFVELDAGNVTTFLRCRFTRNTTGTLGGGALWLTGEARLAHCLLAGNTSVGSGGAVSTNSGLSVKIENCTIVNNSATGASSTGGGVHASGAGPHQLRNCVAWGNTAPGAASVQARNLNAPGTTVFDFCTIQGHAGTVVGGNNGLTPAFIDGPGDDNIVGTDDDRWGPLEFSPLIDSGTTTILGLFSATDLNGDPRYLDDTLVTDSGVGTPPIDRGCYERQLSVIAVCGPSDVGHAGGFEGPDGVLDNNDFIAFISLFFAGDSRADMGRAGGLPGADGLFDNNDFIVFIGQFFDGCP